MTGRSYRSSKPDAWTTPRPWRDQANRHNVHGKLQPMAPEGRSWLSRLLGRII